MLNALLVTHWMEFVVCGSHSQRCYLCSVTSKKNSIRSVWRWTFGQSITGLFCHSPMLWYCTTGALGFNQYSKHGAINPHFNGTNLGQPFFFLRLGVSTQVSEPIRMPALALTQVTFEDGSNSKNRTCDLWDGQLLLIVELIIPWRKCQRLLSGSSSKKLLHWWSSCFLWCSNFPGQPFGMKLPASPMWGGTKYSDDKTIATMLSEIGMFSVQMELARCSEKTWSHKFQGRGCESGCGWQSCSIEAIISNQYMDINISEVRLGSHFDVSFNVHQLHQLVLQSFLVISPSTECSIRNTLAICCYGQ